MTRRKPEIKSATRNQSGRGSRATTTTAAKSEESRRKARAKYLLEKYQNKIIIKGASTNKKNKKKNKKRIKLRDSSFFVDSLKRPMKSAALHWEGVVQGVRTSGRPSSTIVELWPTRRRIVSVYCANHRQLGAPGAVAPANYLAKVTRRGRPTTSRGSSTTPTPTVKGGDGSGGGPGPRAEGAAGAG